ncbi:unnamed protein product [Trichobilharzia szidati]|nr:unnamed protein product [Trichobilharzia szidati]
MNAKNNLQVGDIHQRTVGPIESKVVCGNNQTETSIMPFDSKQVSVDDSSSSDTNSNASTLPIHFSYRISRRSCEWLTEKALEILTTCSFTTVQSPLTSQVHNSFTLNIMYQKRKPDR